MTPREYNEQFSEEELKTEIWKDVPNFEGYYQVSNLGRVRGLDRHRYNFNSSFCFVKGRIIIPFLNSSGRFLIHLYKDSKKEMVQIHRLVLEVFVSPCPEEEEGCHNDGNPFNNRLENLRWDTHKNNIRDKIQHGTYQYGEKNAMAKLTVDEVLEIKKLYATGEYTQKSIGEKFNVIQQTINLIINNKRWYYLEEM